jgi:5-methylcytosine-specific restriction endonuclease McrA
MKCSCGFCTENKKSWSNHLRFGCPKSDRRSDQKCKYCNSLKPKRKPSEQGLFCNKICYGNWRSENLKGSLAPNYVHGKCRENLLFRASREYKRWREQVFKRDGFQCVLCGSQKGGTLEADHIKDFALYPELRLELSNGRTLCKECHKKTENYGNKKSNSKKRIKIPHLASRYERMG